LSGAVRFENVSKRFVLHQERPRSFQELVVGLVRGGGWRALRKEVWALRDFSLEISPGEIVGFIGPNGAGKSTLLKLVAGIIPPTSGRVVVDGRVSALLELGAGFHPDLTGRENIFLNGSILGLSRREIKRRLDEIVAFSELEPFIDVPVKHYSSGMYVRLGFSVAVHTDPEILLIDEVLAVGDAAFQRKCLERINRMRQEGVTILLVSHNLDIVRRICRQAIWLEGGQLLASGAAEVVIQQYARCPSEENDDALSGGERRRWGTREVEIEEVKIVDGRGQSRQVFATGESLTIEIYYRAHRRVERPVFGIAIFCDDGTLITGPNTRFGGLRIPWVEGSGIVRYTVPALPLLKGTYYVSVSSHNWEETRMFDYHDRIYSFRVLPSSEERYGVLTLSGTWSWDRHTEGDIS